MTTSIFLKSYPPDFGFLSFCLKSIHRFAVGFNEIVVVIPSDSDLPLTQEKLIKIVEPASEHSMHGAGYDYQQVVKMNADKYCKSDFICHMDSDSVFTKTVTPQDLMVDEKPIWLMTPMAEVVSGDKNSTAHAESMERFSGTRSEFEFMRRIGQVIPRWAYPAFREYCVDRHSKTFEQWAMSQAFRGVTEFNHMGQFLYENYRNFIHFHDTRFGLPDCFVRQFWSWSGITDEIRKELDMILA